MNPWLTIFGLAVVYALVGRDELDEKIAREQERRMPAAEAIFERPEQLTRMHHPCENVAAQRSASWEPWQERCAKAQKQ